MKTLLRKKVRQLTVLAFATTASLLISVAAHAGPESGGGGNVCRFPNGELRVLDVAHLNRAKFESFIDSLPSLRFAGTSVYRDYGYDSFQPFKLHMKAAKLFLIKKIRQEVGESEAALLDQSLDDLNVLITPKFPSVRPIGADFSKFGSDGRCSAFNTTAVALYSWQIGLVLNGSLWNQLSSFNRMTLLVHEALRNLQIRYGGGFSHKDLQNLTAEIMNGEFDRFKVDFKAALLPKPLTANKYMKGVCGSFGQFLAEKSQHELVLKSACERPDPKNLWRLLNRLYPKFDSIDEESELRLKHRVSREELVLYLDDAIWAYATSAKVPHTMTHGEFNFSDTMRKQFYFAYNVEMAHKDPETFPANSIRDEFQSLLRGIFEISH